MAKIEMMKGSTALVTGGAIRLGRAIALDLAKAGYHIALHYNSSRTAAEETCTEIRELGVACELFRCDLKHSFQAWLLDDATMKFQKTHWWSFWPESNNRSTPRL